MGKYLDGITKAWSHCGNADLRVTTPTTFAEVEHLTVGFPLPHMYNRGTQTGLPETEFAALNSNFDASLQPFVTLKITCLQIIFYNNNNNNSFLQTGSSATSDLNYIDRTSSITDVIELLLRKDPTNLRPKMQPSSLIIRLPALPDHFSILTFRLGSCNMSRPVFSGKHLVVLESLGH